MLAVDVKANLAAVKGPGDVVPLAVPCGRERRRGNDLLAVGRRCRVELNPEPLLRLQAIGAAVAVLIPHSDDGLEDARDIRVEIGLVVTHPRRHSQALRTQLGVSWDRHVRAVEEPQRGPPKHARSTQLGSRGSAFGDAPRKPWFPLPDQSRTTWPEPSFRGHQPPRGKFNVAAWAAAGMARVTATAAGAVAQDALEDHSSSLARFPVSALDLWSDSSAHRSESPTRSSVY